VDLLRVRREPAGGQQPLGELWGSGGAERNACRSSWHLHRLPGIIARSRRSRRRRPCHEGSIATLILCGKHENVFLGRSKLGGGGRRGILFSPLLPFA